MRNFLIAIIAFFLINFSHAQTNYYVNNSLGSDISGNGTGTGTLAWKTIEYAVNNVPNPAADSIIINISGDIFNLSNNQIDIDRNFLNLTLIGQGIDATIIEPASDTSLSNSREIKIYFGNKVLLKNLTVRYGKTLSSDSLGGGILNQGTLVIDYCKVTENLVNKDGHGGIGGGIANEGGNLTIKNSTISFNTAPDSGQGGGIGSVNGTLNIYNSTICYNIGRLTVGGIFVASRGADAFFNMENSTIFGNTAFKYGGIRITRFGYPSTPYNVTSNINSCTVFNNSADDVYGGFGLTVPSNCSIKNTIVAGNFAYNQGPIASASDLTGSSGSIAITSDGYNIFQTVSNITITGSTNNGIGLDPKLQPLANNNTANGTQTCATDTGSPAINAIPGGNGAPLLDQRGAVRNGDYDIGAYEFWPDNALPVELISFTAKVVNDEVVLNWETATEVNNYGFEVERQIDNKWEKLGFVSGNGNSNKSHGYSFVDRSLLDGNKFLYRLKQIDNDGKFEYSKIIEVQVFPSEYQLYQNYPNPFNPVTEIKYAIPKSGLVTVKVYDIIGNEIATLVNANQSEGIHSVTFNAEKFPSGIYIYKIQTESFTAVKKMILLK